MKNKIIIGIFIVICLGFLYGSKNIIVSSFYKANNLAAAFFSIGVSVKDLVFKYDQAKPGGKIKILIVPGHEPRDGGARYKNLKERTLNLQLGEKLKNILAQNPRFEVVMSRDENGWNPELKSYVDNNKKEIDAWVKDRKKEMLGLVDDGKFTIVEAEMGHATAAPEAATFLFGINKWASENGVDVTLHLHFNDNPKYKDKPNYEGFSIYVPEKQYSNSISSKILAKDILIEMLKIQKISTMKKESGGIIEDQELIALGRYNTADSLSVLTEYSYIYEDFMQSTTTRDIFIDKAASSTAQALENFFESRR